MLEKYGKYYADWYDRNGKRRRKGFPTEAEARAYQEAQKAKARPQKRGASRSQTHSRHFSAATLAHSTPHRSPKRSSKRTAKSAAANSAASTQRSSTRGSTATKTPSRNIAERALRNGILRYLWEEFGAPRLHSKITKVTKPKPRNVTATTEERAAIIAAAPPALRCWLLLCSDCAIRSGTAARLTPAEYDSAQRILTFRTKYQNAQQLPVTAELAKLLDACKDTALPFVQQLDRGPVQGQKVGTLDYQALSKTFGRLKHRLGITRKLTPHDLRRTTARQVYAITHDLRTVQALLGHAELSTTLWYLQDNLQTVPVSALEVAKLNPLTERPQ